MKIREISVTREGKHNIPVSLTGDFIRYVAYKIVYCEDWAVSDIVGDDSDFSTEFPEATKEDVEKVVLLLVEQGMVRCTLYKQGEEPSLTATDKFELYRVLFG